MSPFALDRESLRSQICKLSFCLKPRHRARFRNIGQEDAAKLSVFTRETYKNFHDEGDLDAEICNRLNSDRYEIVPWLDAALPLDGAKVLEIGCGTGESTLALSEQGACVTGIDIDEGALAVARERCRLYGLEAEFMLMNAVDVAAGFKGRHFDVVIFFASLEHMVLDERLTAMRATWSILREGGLWCVIEAPNRLWFYDGHTANENFYHWLPDELAGRWAHRSRRAAFANLFPAGKAVDPIVLARWGRGISFHEFDLAFGDARKLDVVSNKKDFIKKSNPLLYLHQLTSPGRRYERFLESLEPDIDPGFFRQYLDLAIRKH